MKAPEKLVQLHGSVIGNREIIKREIFILRDHASLTADVAMKFGIWLIAMPYSFVVSKGLTTHKELFDYFIEHIYKPE